MKTKTTNAETNETAIALPRPPLNKTQIAKYYGKSVRTIENWMANKQIPFFKRGGSPMFDLDVVREHDRRCCRIGGGN